MATNFQWTCHHCQLPQIVTDSNYFNASGKILNPPGEFGNVCYEVHSITCQNRDCGKMTFGASVHTRTDWANSNYYQAAELVQSWALMPESNAKPQPDYIPKGLIEDYAEACRIRDLSPKASATLARRCLQGMIRHFCKISLATLDKEIKALREAVNEGTAPRGVTPESVDGIDHVRKVGNIGAHMESDVNMIVDIEPGEAQMLIELVETLFDEWYVAQHKREQRFAGVKALAEAKKEEILQLKTTTKEQKLLDAPKN